jgi:hypothetical protein
MKRPTKRMTRRQMMRMAEKVLMDIRQNPGLFPAPPLMEMEELDSNIKELYDDAAQFPTPRRIAFLNRKADEVKRQLNLLRNYLVEQKRMVK